MAVEPQQRGLFLCPGDGDPEVLVVPHAQRHGAVVAQGFGDLAVGQRLGLDAADLRRRFVRGELQGADAIPADMPEQVETPV